MFQKYLTGSVTVALCLAVSLPYQVIANCDCTPCFQAPCCDPCGSDNGRIGLYALGAVLLGAAAGAGAGYAAGHRSNHHCGNCKHHCDPCDRVLHNYPLNFNVFIEDFGGPFTTPITDPTGTITLSFFAVSPSGLITYGTVFDHDITEIGTVGGFGTNAISGSVTLNANSCGTYQIGLIVDSPYEMEGVFFTRANVQVLENQKLNGVVVKQHDLGAEEFDFNSGVFSAQFIIADYTITPECCVKEASCQKFGG